MGARQRETEREKGRKQERQRRDRRLKEGREGGGREGRPTYHQHQPQCARSDGAAQEQQQRRDGVHRQHERRELPAGAEQQRARPKGRRQRPP